MNDWRSALVLGAAAVLITALLCDYSVKLKFRDANGNEYEAGFAPQS